MKKALAFLLVAVLLFSITSCGSNKQNTGTSTESSNKEIVCRNCGQKYESTYKYCPNCGAKSGEVSQQGSTADLTESSSSSRIPMDSHISYTLLSYLKEKSESQTLFLYYINKFSKDEKIYNVYAIKNGKCRLYKCKTTLGELAKMTDAEIEKMLEDYYGTGLTKAIDTWNSNSKTLNAINSGRVMLYDPRYYDITGSLFTDDSGNNVKGEMLIFPRAGIDDKPYVIYYPQYNDSTYEFMNYYGTSLDRSSNRDIDFKVVYFNTGHGAASDFNVIIDAFYIPTKSVVTGTVYKSNYFGFETSDNKWTSGGSILCFREKNAFVLDLGLDKIDSGDIAYLDPQEKEIKSITSKYYNGYYNSFKSWSE